MKSPALRRPWPWLFVSAFLVSCPGRSLETQKPLVTSIRDLRSFGRAGVYGERQLEVRGVVTAFDAENGTIYLQDATGAMALDVGDLGAPVLSGESVLLSGGFDPGAPQPRLRRPHVTVLGRTDVEMTLPARPLDVDGLFSSRAEAEWIEVHGVVRAARLRGQIMHLDLYEAGRPFRVEVLHLEQTPLPYLPDCRVRIRGVRASRRRSEPVDILVPDSAYIRIEQDPPADRFAIPVTSLSRLVRVPAANLPDHRVRVQGTVARTVDAGHFVLSAESREYDVAASLPPEVAVGAAVDVIGFVTADGEKRFLDAAEARPVGGPMPTPTRAKLPLLTLASEVRGLTREQGSEGYPVRLQGIVTYNNPEMRVLFIQDASEGVYVEAWRHIHHVQPGDRVIVEGQSGTGAFAPIVHEPRVTVLSHGPLPPARRVRAEQIVTGEEDSQWVEVEGVVRAVTFDPQGAVIRLASGGVRLLVDVPHVADPQLPARLVNARVLVRGVCRSILTQRNQLADVALDSPSLDSLSILTPPPAEPFAVPVLSVNSLLQFVRGQSWEHRVRVQGVVTYAQPGDIYVRDATGGVHVNVSGRHNVKLGELVEIIGFATSGEYSPVLQDAEIRSLGRSAAAEPIAITPEQALGGGFDGALVSLEARLLDSIRGRDDDSLRASLTSQAWETRLFDSTRLHEGQQLLMQAGPYLFSAFLHGPEPAGLRPGSGLRLTGICAVSTGEQHFPQSFRLLVRSPSDIDVVQAAPWWTPQHATWALAATATVALLAFAWVMTLRKRVQDQSAIIWRRVKHETELQERQRMARQLHDTLEQNLAGIGLSLEAVSLTLASRPTIAEQHLTRALEQVDGSIEEVHRAVWALRDESLEERGLAAALDEIGQQLASSSPTPILVRTAVEGVTRPFAVSVENNLLHIGQEAMTNAVRHGKANEIHVRLHFDAQVFDMRVSDNGRGFDLNAPVAPGHFGLVGMRERAQEIGARLEVKSSVNRGTEVHVTVPLQPLTLQQAG